MSQNDLIFMPREARKLEDVALVINCLKCKISCEIDELAFLLLEKMIRIQGSWFSF